MLRPNLRCNYFNWNIEGSGSNVATQLDKFLSQPAFKSPVVVMQLGFYQDNKFTFTLTITIIETNPCLKMCIKLGNTDNDFGQ